MTAPVPKKTASVIYDEIMSVILVLGRYLEADDPRVLRWNDELTKAMPAGRAIAFLTMADVAHVMGDMELFERMISRAETQGANEAEVRARRQSIYNNLGYASEGLKLIQGLYSIRAQNIGSGLPRAVSTGGFSLARDLLEQARLAKLDLSHVDQINEITQIAEASRNLGLPDEEFARVLDIAGGIMRERRLLWLDRAPRFSFDDEMGCPGIRYRLEVTPEEAAEIDFEFINKLITADLDRVPFTVGFVGTLETALAEA